MPTTIINQYSIVSDGLKLMLQAPLEKNSIAKTHPLNAMIHTCEEEYVSNGVTLKKEVSNNHAFHIQFAVLVNGQCLGHIYSDPTKRYGYGKHLRPLHVGNDAFYTMPYPSLILQLLEAFDLEVHNVSNIDLTIYTQQIDPAAFIKSFTRNQAEYERVKRKGDKGFKIYGSEDETNGEQQCTTYIGENNKRVVLAIYNKTKELLDKDHKPYLSAWLAGEGFSTDKPTYSFELSIKAEALNQYKPLALTEDGEIMSVYRASKLGHLATNFTEKKKTRIEIGKLQNPAYLASVFEEFFPLDIRKKDKAHISKRTKVELIDFSLFGEEQVNSIVSISSKARTTTKEKRLIRELLQQFQQTGCPLCRETSASLAQRYDLNDFLSDVMKKLNISPTIEAPTLHHPLTTYEALEQLDIAA